MKFKNYLIKTDELGFEFVKNGIMVGSTERGCIVCGEPTKYIEVVSEGHFCSDECVDKFYERLSDAT